MSVCSQKTFRWSEKELTLEELVSQYRRLIPFPILVTQGYMPHGGRRSSSSVDEVYWVHDVIEHTWIVLKNEHGAEIRVPECYSATVVPIKADGKDGNVFPFRNVRRQGGFKYFRFLEPIMKVTTASDGETTRYALGELEIIDVYQEKYLVIHPVYMENLMKEFSPRGNGNTEPQASVVFPKFDILPSYLPICVSVGVSLAMAPDAIYFHTMAEIKIVADSYPHDPEYPARLQQAAEILLVAEKKQTNDYDYIDMSKSKTKKLQEKSSIFRIPVGLRNDLVTLSKDLDPGQRLADLHVFYDTGNMGAADADVTELEDDGYLEPSTWLALQRNSGTTDSDDEDYRDYDDVFHPGKVQASTPQRGVPPVVNKGPGVSWLRDRFQGYAAPQSSHNRPTSKSDQIKLNPPRIEAGNTTRRQSVADRIMEFSSQGATLPAQTAPPVPQRTESHRRPAPPAPCTAARRPVLTVSPQERTNPTPPWSGLGRKYSLDSQTAVVNPIRVSNPKANSDLFAELRDKITPRAVSNTARTAPDADRHSARTPRKSRITSMEDVPTDISGLSADGISDCLRCLNLSQYAAAMRESMVDGGLLTCLHEDDLKTEFGFTNVNAKKLIQFAKYGWRPM